MLFGDRLKTLRETEKLTQEEMGKICSVSKANISKYESNLIHPPLDTLRIIAEHFNVTIDYLLGFTSEKNKNLELEDEYIAVLHSAKINNITPERLKRLIDFLNDQDNKED